MAVDAFKYRMSQAAIAKAATRPVPSVQRPGVAAERETRRGRNLGSNGTLQSARRERRSRWPAQRRSRYHCHQARKIIGAIKLSDPIGEQIAKYGALDENESWEGFKRGFLLKPRSSASLICIPPINGWRLGSGVTREHASMVVEDAELENLHYAMLKVQK